VEQLGFKSGDRLLIINADDFGVSPAVNVGTLKALKFGLVKTTTIIVPGPAFDEAAKMVKDNPGLDVGIHLTLSCGYGKGNFGPVLSPREVPSLVGKNGYFRGAAEIIFVNKEEAVKEFRAQIARAIAAGIQPSHIDCHMGCYEWRLDLFMAAIQLAKEYGLPMRNGLALRKFLVRWKGVLSSDRFSMFYDVDESRREQTYFSCFKQLKSGVNELAVHVAEPIPGRMDDPSEHGRRDNELRIFTSPKTRELLDQLGIKLIGYRELQRLQKNPRQSAK
jgi:predicted glycoside hydrolase/deacetylase ChbG (UPF0249 family)